MTGRDLEQASRLIADLTRDQRLHLFRLLRNEFGIHPLEEELNVPAEVILEAIARSSDLTLRGIRGVIAEAVFATDIVAGLNGWKSIELEGNAPYDFLLRDAVGDVRVQVKMQRQLKHRPMLSDKAPRRCGLPPDHYVVETQRTRGGRTASGSKTRPYRFDEFDILAVSLHPSTNAWSRFLFTLASWLVPDGVDLERIQTYQAVPKDPDQHRWTDELSRAIAWLRTADHRPLPFERQT